MNQAFFEYAMNIIDNLTDEELYEGLTKAGFDVTIRQYPEPEEKESSDEQNQKSGMVCNCIECYCARRGMLDAE